MPVTRLLCNWLENYIVNVNVPEFALLGVGRKFTF